MKENHHRKRRPGHRCTKGTIKMCQSCKNYYSKSSRRNSYCVIYCPDFDFKTLRNNTYLLRSLDKGNNWELLKEKKKLVLDKGEISPEEYSVRVFPNFPPSSWSGQIEMCVDEKAKGIISAVRECESEYLVCVFEPIRDKKKYVKFCGKSYKMGRSNLMENAKRKRDEAKKEANSYRV